MLPSPTAAATRLTEWARTSPTANTPGRLLSRRYGPLPTAAQLLSDSTAAGMSSPVGINPERSRCTAPASQDVRLAANHGEQVVCGHVGVLASAAVLDHDRVELAVTVYRSHHSAGVHSDTGIVLDAVEEIGRDGLGQPIAPHKHKHAVPRRREGGGRLASGVAPADDDDGLPRLDFAGVGRRVEHAQPLEPLDAATSSPR
jgi:hypothetical protein